MGLVPVGEAGVPLADELGAERLQHHQALRRAPGWPRSTTPATGGRAGRTGRPRPRGGGCDERTLRAPSADGGLTGVGHGAPFARRKLGWRATSRNSSASGTSSAEGGAQRLVAHPSACRSVGSRRSAYGSTASTSRSPSCRSPGCVVQLGRTGDGFGVAARSLRDRDVSMGSSFSTSPFSSSRTSSVSRYRPRAS